MESSPNQPPRYTWRTLLQAVTIGLGGQVVTVLLLRDIASPQATTAAASGVFFGALWFWRPQARRHRYWRGFLAVTIFTAALWVLLGGILGLFRP